MWKLQVGPQIHFLFKITKTIAILSAHRFSVSRISFSELPKTEGIFLKFSNFTKTVSEYSTHNCRF